MPVNTARRYYLLKRLAAALAGDEELAAVWRSKQEATTGTALPEGFPLAAKLALAGYLVAQDLDGADEGELATNADLSSREALAVIAAIAAL